MESTQSTHMKYTCRNKKIKDLILLVVFPLLIGTLIYVLFRSNSILFNSWMKDSGFFTYLLKTRLLIQNSNLTLNRYLVYNLPDGLWLFSWLNFLLIIWEFEINKTSRLVIIASFLAAISSELLQGLGFLSGTYDICDLFAYVLATFCVFIIFKQKTKNKK
jgi:hypothetical protein